MKFIQQAGDRCTVEMSRHELDSLVQYLVDVDGKAMFLDGDELGDLTEHIFYHISGHVKVDPFVLRNYQQERKG